MKKWKPSWYSSNLPPGRIWHKVIFNVGSQAQIENHEWLVQKMLNSVGIFLLGHLRHQPMNLVLQNRYCQWGSSIGPGIQFSHHQAKKPHTKWTLSTVSSVASKLLVFFQLYFLLQDIIIQNIYNYVII